MMIFNFRKNKVFAVKKMTHKYIQLLNTTNKNYFLTR